MQEAVKRSPVQIAKEESQQVTIELLRQLITLATSGFGLVAALAWNSVIQELVSTYIKKWLPAGWGIVSLLIYALTVTIVAVLVTYNLSKSLKRLTATKEAASETLKKKQQRKSLK